MESKYPNFIPTQVSYHVSFLVQMHTKEQAQVKFLEKQLILKSPYKKL